MVSVTEKSLLCSRHITSAETQRLRPEFVPVVEIRKMFLP
jgi:hypothetical protein